MRIRNTGKKSEQLFDEAFALLGKRAFVFAFTDSSKATGRNGRVTAIDAQPSDRLLVVGGSVEFAEVKSTTDGRIFSFSLLRKTQSAYARMILAAGGEYTVYLHSLAHGSWYRIPYQVIAEWPRRSMTWGELNPYKWSLPCIQTS